MRKSQGLFFKRCISNDAVVAIPPVVAPFRASTGAHRPYECSPCQKLEMPPLQTRGLTRPWLQFVVEVLAMVHTERLRMQTAGDCDIIDITDSVANLVRQSGMRNGIVTVFVPGSTAGLTTVEYEPGLVKDLEELFEKIAPSDRSYHHDMRWGDGNGYSHVRASLLGPSLTVPVAGGAMTLGTWQQIVLIDMDNRPRTREIVVQVMGE